MAKDAQEEIFKYFSAFEKRFGSRQGIEDVVWNKRRKKYEDQLTKDPEDYDTWFDYLRMVESEGDSDVIRDTYERAVANIPESPNKNDWRRYIYLWVTNLMFDKKINLSPPRYTTTLESVTYSLTPLDAKIFFEN